MNANQTKAYRVLRAFAWPADLALSKVREGSGLEIAARWQKDMQEECFCIDMAVRRLERSRAYHIRSANLSHTPFSEIARYVWQREYSTGRALVARHAAAQA